MAQNQSALKNRVKDILLNHKGEDNAISSREISDRLDQDEVGSFPGTRFIVRELVLEEGIPVASSNKGYYVIETEGELRDYVDNLESRILGMSERKWAVQKAASQWSGDIETSEDYDLL